VSLSVLILTNRAPFPLHDGGALAMDAMIRGYMDAGCQVGLLMMNTSRHHVEENTVRERYVSLSRLRIVPVDNEVRIGALLKNLLFSSEPEHVARFRDESFRLALLEMLETMRPDVVQLESPFLGTYIKDIRDVAPKALLLYRMHNVEAQIWSRLSESVSGPKSWYLKVLAARIDRFERDLWEKSDLLLPITSTDAEWLKEHNISTPYVVSPVAFSAIEEAQSWPEGPLRLYHLGAMDWLPNQEAIRWFLTEVWPQASERFPEMEFHFAGRNMPEEFLKDLPRNAFCAAEVSDAKEFIRNKHVLVVPLKSGGGLRIKILEAMSLGRLVISSAVGIQGLEAENGVHYFRADDPNAWLNLIGRLHRQPQLARQIAVQGQSWLQTHFDERIIMNRILEEIERLKMSAKDNATTQRAS
jgi:hypothetical protein